MTQGMPPFKLLASHVLQYFPERTEHTLAGLQNRLLFPDGEAGPKSQDFLGGHSLATLMSNFLCACAADRELHSFDCIRLCPASPPAIAV